MIGSMVPPQRGLPMNSTGSDCADAAPSSTAVALAPMREVWQALLATHVPDRDERCMACRWQTRAADKWPCGVYLLAAAAQRVATSRQGLGR
jgi:hypothetical protein